MEITYATGEEWFRYDIKFGPESRAFKADEVFRFTKQSDGYSGYEVTLYPVQGGNLKTEPIQSSEF